MNISFIKYDQITETIYVGISDPRGGFRKLTFTMDAIDELIHKPSGLGENMKRIRTSIIDKGGLEWIKKEITKFQREMVEGKAEMIRERL